LLCNVVYALLAERAESSDRHLWPVALTHAGERQKPGELFADLSHRAHLDEWLAASAGRDAAAEQALTAYLTGR
jgi:hypothetical protein